MLGLRIFGVLLSAAGGVALVLAITAMNKIGSCGNGYDAPCPPGIGRDFGLMAGGVVGIAVGAACTLGMGLALSLLTAGLTGLAYVLRGPASVRTGSIVIAAICLPLAAAGGFVVGGVLSSRTAARERAAERASELARFKAAAVRIPGTVVSLEDTGTTIDDNPVARVRIRFTGADSGEHTVDVVETLPRLRIPRPGDPVELWYDPRTGRAVPDLPGVDRPATDAVPPEPFAAG